MTRHWHRTLVVGACTLGGALAVGTAGATSVDAVEICHGTASGDTPYVLITVDASALAGHFDGTDPGHGWQSAPDVFPVDGVCPGDDGGGGPE